MEDGRDVALELRRLVHGDLRGMFDGPTTDGLRLDGPLVVLDLSAVYHSPALGVLMACAAAWLQTRSQRAATATGSCWWSTRPGRSSATSGWPVGSSPPGSCRGPSAWPTWPCSTGCRTWPSVGAAGSEQVGLAEGLLADSETRVVYAQSPGEVARTGELLGLTDTEAELVTQLRRGTALWKVGRRSFLVEHRLAAGRAVAGRHRRGDERRRSAVRPRSRRRSERGPSTAVVLGAAALGTTVLLPKPAAGSRSPARATRVGLRARGTAPRPRDGQHAGRGRPTRELSVSAAHASAGRAPRPRPVGTATGGGRAGPVGDRLRPDPVAQDDRDSPCRPSSSGGARCVAASVKTDLLADTLAHRRTLGRVQCFDPTGATGSPPRPGHRCRAPAPGPGRAGVAATLTEVGRASVGTHERRRLLVRHGRQACWRRSSSPPPRGGREMADVVHWVETGEEARGARSCWSTPECPRRSMPPGPPSRKEERQRSSIVTTVETLLEPFAGGREPRRDAGEPGGDRSIPTGCSRAPTPLYLCAPAHDQRRLTPLFVGVLRAVLDGAYDRVARAGRPLDPPLLVVLDEAANIAPIPDLDALAATAAGHGVQLVTVWHDLAQITRPVRSPGPTVVNNHRAKLFLSGISDPSTLDYASHLMGDEELRAAAPRPRADGAVRAPPIRRRCAGWRRPTHCDGCHPATRSSSTGTFRRPGCRLRTWFDDRWLRSLVAGPEAGPGVRPEPRVRPGARGDRARPRGPGRRGAAPRGAGR